MEIKADVYKIFRQIQEEAEKIYNKGYTLEIAVHLENGQTLITEMFVSYIDFEKQIFYCPGDNGGLNFTDIRTASVVSVVPFADEQWLKPLESEYE